MRNKYLNIIGIIAVAAAIFFATRETEMTSGIDIKNMDTTVAPGDDFYNYATGGWQKLHPIPDDYARYGAFQKLDEMNLERTREIAESDDGKIGKLYDIAMDAEKLNADGVRPAQKLFDEIDAIKSRDDLPKYLGRMQKYSSAFWGDGVSLDEMNSEFYIYNIGQGGIGLPRDYYFANNDNSDEIRAKYKKYIADIMKNFGMSVNAEKIYEFEKRMAASFHTKEVLRDPHANYHKKSYDEFKNEFSNFDWDSYFAARGVRPDDLNVNQPAAIGESLKIISDTDLDLIKDYLRFQVANDITGILDDATYEISFDFFGRTMTGQKTPKARWKRSVAILDGSLGEEVGRLYVKKYFPIAAKERMDNLVENLRRAYAMRIEKLDWMSIDTKRRALEKLAAFNAKIGYPTKWRDYSALEIQDDSLLDNMVRVSEFEDAFWLAKAGREKDPTIWFMNAHTVNAYYDPTNNEICFPAGILQPPFFDMNADDAFNYGAIGVVIGHEMTHGFDDQGRKFDKDGDLKDWWTDADSAAFDARAKVMRGYFDKILVAPNLYANGEFTLGETLADSGGLTIAFTAYKNFGTPTDDRTFFIANAGVWAGNIRDAEIIRLTETDEHPLARHRVNGIMPHIDEWYETFGIKPTDKLYLSPNLRARVW
ncbi:MAG: M13 family metallopeptidase [Rickettsiales bacterium]|jgi:putative endopeptidase|nr:M13 family metallopeptidase [Rickettsiales bacterium]